MGQVGWNRPSCPKYGNLHSEVCHKRLGKCFNYGLMGHFKKDYPQLQGGSSQGSVQVATSTPSLPTLSQGGRGTGGRGLGGKGANGRGSGFSGRRQSWLYALTHQDAQASNVVIAGTFRVNSFETYVLFDLGSTHSYVSSFFAPHFDELPLLLNPPFWISTPTEGTLLIQSLFKSWIINVCGIETLADLMLLSMVDFDVILGMDWLASCHATVDCHDKVVKFEVLGEPFLVFQGDRCLMSATLITLLSSLRLMSKGNLGLLPLVRNVEAEVLKLDQVAVDGEFPDVFPTELPRMPPEREIEFCVELIPDA